MDFIEFVIRNNGKKVDFDGAFGYQCVDLARAFIRDVWDLPQPRPVVGAIDFHLKFENDTILKTFCYKTGPGLGKAGDLLVRSSTQRNKFGHIAIIIGRTSDHYMVFHQDGFKQDGANIGFFRINDVINAGVIRKRGMNH